MAFAKHKTFYIREGWLPKGLKLIKEKPYIFTPANREKAIENLGIGKTMVTALRFWMKATGLTEEGRGSNSMIEHQVTKLGDLIASSDPYFEDVQTLWLIHYKLSTQKELATTWYWFFNHFDQGFFDQTAFIEALDSYIKEELNKDIATSSLKKDFLCLKNTYLYERNYNYSDNPEDILSSPLSNLKLLINRGKQGFQMHDAAINNLNSEVIYYAILDNHVLEAGEQISFTKLLKTENSVGKVFNLSRRQLLKYLEFLENLKYLDIQKGFGHNLITINEANKFEVLKKMYNNNKSEGIRYV